MQKPDAFDSCKSGFSFKLSCHTDLQSVCHLFCCMKAFVKNSLNYNFGSCGVEAMLLRAFEAIMSSVVASS